MEPLRDLIITPEILRFIAEIDEFKGRWQALGDLAPARLSALRRVATIESVASSTRIEGVKLSDDEVERLLSGIETRSFRTRDEQEVAGYAAVMEMVFESWREISLTENHLKQLHQELLRYSDRDEFHRGRYKTLPNHVEAYDADGRSLGVIFETATPFATPQSMASLVPWAAAALDGDEHHPLLVIAVFIVRFLAIHPFQDGNGRLSRVVTMLLLLRAGYDYVPYSSLERVVEENKEAYYRALRRAQATLDKGEENLGDWLVFFLRCLVREKDWLAHKVKIERRMAPLLPLAQKLLESARQHGRLTLSGAVAATGANRNTVKSHL
ncbi:MAG: Fic family protein, partial [bacterium]|nr:Fic family protein [bacterium]